MMELTLYHNPRCSKSRKTLELLEGANVAFTVVEYLKQPLSADGLREIVSRLGDEATVADIIRPGEATFRNAGLSLSDGDSLYDAIAKQPILMQRPIVVAGDRAAIGRPPESVLELLS